MWASQWRQKVQIQGQLRQVGFFQRPPLLPLLSPEMERAEILHSNMPSDEI